MKQKSHCLGFYQNKFPGVSFKDTKKGMYNNIITYKSEQSTNPFKTTSILLISWLLISELKKTY